MIANDLLRWGLTAPLLAAALYAAFRAGRKSPPATRVGFGLHAAMMAAMVLMLTPGFSWAVLPQILFFGLAAWWFILRAVSRRPVAPAGPGPGRSRLPRRAGPGCLLYEALTMAAMAYMLAAMDVRGAHGTLAEPGTAELPGSAGHHGGAAAGLSLPVPLPDSLPGWSHQPALVLAVAFGAAGAVWGALLFRRLRADGGQWSRTFAGSGSGSGSSSHTGCGEAFLQLVAAASMAVMFAGLAG
ncbi:DUF5134 domain-containing protein [Arthrobacter sp. U41]|uniref:DUF5134 domain-containing protein n=1 Tax=Arthrobacter sp. U41 TaxID=1849032 RepID=UPI000859483F|nr:DUF5134 domain-containing protein [Arthrobacter sp. U41]AOT04459.1 hypothetical protein ASPU41_15200 [Arthrobacter sp. U41]